MDTNTSQTITALEQIAEAIRYTTRCLALNGFGADVFSISARYDHGSKGVVVSVQADTHAGTNRVATYLGCRDAKIVGEDNEFGGTLIYDCVKLVGASIKVAVYGPALNA